MRRSTKYLNAREYAQRLALNENPDIADFGRDFLDALDFSEDGEIQRLIDGYTKDAPDDVITYTEKVEWLGKGSDTLGEVEQLIADKCPEYSEMDTEEAVMGMISRLRPVQEYDL